ncbi:GTPase-activating protein CdGAPr-like [Oncorhynchus clarkii lewisi]|uniref:GTPase-activating protein CdGAPr-like n=1 Tax=Oncorhynchus clarkii lewisi TaxID=490388 RepID=UPI0039B98C2A
MPNPMDDRLRVVAVIHALKASGVRVKNWKNFLNGPYTSDPVRQENQSKFAFGRDLILLPQCDLTDLSGTVPKFLVDACEFLSQHLHTEGLFRKTGSFSRMRALRAGLEQGEPVFSLPHSATLQPCDVASLVKQFLRELPSPLIPMDLQVPLCRAQGFDEEEGRQEQGEDGALLLTALFPPSHSRALRYFCTFLRQTAQRCKENRMEVGNLALVIAPNLLHCPAGGSKLTAGTERRLHRQAAVIKKLIIHAHRIGVVPPSIMDMATVAESSTPPVDGGRFQERAGLGVYRLLGHQRRRSVGEIFVDALSKLKTGRTHTDLLHPPDSQQNTKTAHHNTLESPITSKRKSTEDPVPDVESSAKKRHPVQEDKAHRRTSLRFFNMTVWSSPDPSPTSIGNDTENWIMGSIMVTDGMTEASSSEVGPSRIPVIMTDGMTGPSRIPVIMTDVLVRSEVEDDPDLPNYSFAENPDHFLDLATLDSPSRTQAGESCECSGVKLETETIVETVRQNETNHVLRDPEQVGIKEDPDDVGLSKKQSEVDISVSQKPRHPRRSISMPEVTLDQLRIQDETYKKEKTDWMIEKEDGVSGDTLQLPVKKEKMTESGLGFKRTHMSVAERIRRFNALTTLLRNPRVPPRPPEPQLNDVLHESQREGGQRSVVRLRRQGARRFGRSISHDGVPGPWPGQASKNHQEVPVVVQSLSEPVLCPPPEPTPSAYQFAQEGQFDIQHTPQLQQEHLMQTIQDLCAPPSPNPKQDKDSCQVTFKESQLNLKERQLEPVEEQPKESELHDLLEMHLNTCNPKEEQDKHLTVPIQVNRPFLTDTVLDGPPQTMAPLQQESKSFIEIDMGVSESDGGSLPVELSPSPALQFKLPATKRRYRDSPCWPVHEISMATGDPLQI